MNMRPILLGLLALALAMAACAPAPVLRDETLLADTSFLTGEPCEAPCWRGITPGETAWRDAITIIEDSPDLENLQTQADEASGAVGAAWNAVGGAECCQMVARDGETVDLIFLRTRPEMTLGDVVDVRGEPAYAVGTGVTEDQSIVHLVYPELDTILLAFAAGEQAPLDEDSEIIGVLYTTDADMELFLQTQFLHEWEGYAPFGTYRQAEDAEYEITPSVTLTPTPAQ